MFYDNPFLELYEGATAAVEQLVECVKGINFYPYELKWRGNPAIEIGDTITLTLADETTVNIIYLGETLKYTGGLSATSEWKETEQEKVNSNPTNLGEAIKQTYSKVDKVNKKIEIVASEATANTEAIAAIRLDTESISATVKSVEDNIATNIDGINEALQTLTSEVETKITAEDLTIAIKSEMTSGVDKVTTSTGFTFNEEGLTVSKTDSEMKTQITEDGMTVYKNEEAVLIANNVGVEATNLHATTYLIIGTNSRFEDYNGGARTGCFWIGGAGGI